jgi:hypothetical protein
LTPAHIPTLDGEPGSRDQHLPVRDYRMRPGPGDFVRTGSGTVSHLTNTPERLTTFVAAVADVRTPRDDLPVDVPARPAAPRNRHRPPRKRVQGTRPNECSQSTQPSRGPGNHMAPIDGMTGTTLAPSTKPRPPFAFQPEGNTIPESEIATDPARGSPSLGNPTKPSAR